MHAPSPEPNAELAQLADRLLDPTATPGEHWSGVQRLHAFFGELSPLGEHDPCSADHDRVGLASGVAISQVEAARCITDYARTTKFLQAIDRAIRQRLQRSSHPVHLFYAGCGPFATLVTPLLTKYSPEQVQVTLLDIQDRALESTQKVWEVLGLIKHLRARLRDDASTIRLIEGQSVDVLISETMQRALAKEPQVAIYRNLVPQLRADADLIPASVAVSVKLIDGSVRAGVDAPGYVREMGLVFELSRRALRTFPEGACDQLPANSIQLPKTIPEGRQLVLSTTVQILDELQLRDHESSLTMPVVINPPTKSSHESTLDFRYRLGSLPGLAWSHPE